MSAHPPSTDGMMYTLDDRPSLLRTIVLGAQHVLTMFGSTVAVPLLLGPAMDMTIEQTATLISAVMLCSGVATLIQVTFGSRLPIIQGVSFSFIAGFSLFMGLSVPAYFTAVGRVEQMQSGETLAIYRPTAESLLDELPTGARGLAVSLGTTGMGVAAVIGLLLDNLIPGTDQQRGLRGPTVLIPEGRDEYHE